MKEKKCVFKAKSWFPFSKKKKKVIVGYKLDNLFLFCHEQVCDPRMVITEPSTAVIYVKAMGHGAKASCPGLCRFESTEVPATM